jgi:hypothetical protein
MVIVQRDPTGLARGVGAMARQITESKSDRSDRFARQRRSILPQTQQQDAVAKLKQKPASLHGGKMVETPWPRLSIRSS